MIRHIIIFALVLFCVVYVSQAAYFSHYAGALEAYCYNFAEDSDETDGPYEVFDEDTSFASAAEWAAVSDSYSDAYNHIWGYTDGDCLCLQLTSWADGIADYQSSYTKAWGYGSADSPQTRGIFYRIMPDATEEFGDEVSISYSDNISVYQMGSTYVYVGGPGDMNHMAVTIGQSPPVETEPNSAYEVLTWDNLQLTDEGGDWFSGIYKFPAKIGDVVGIFAENYTDVRGWGPLDGLLQSDLWIVLTVRVLLAGDIDDDGDVDLYDLAELAENWLVGTDGGQTAGIGYDIQNIRKVHQPKTVRYKIPALRLPARQR
ncbi:MAG: hypothetical protein JXB29_02745 [Sedimentisphaerales bacterium]|nr:hypothetical protein [Sedimentisphaerales bacterium]